jgi:hypothetical protein
LDSEVRELGCVGGGHLVRITQDIDDLC